jgi:hypothetical protein
MEDYASRVARRPVQQPAQVMVRETHNHPARRPVRRDSRPKRRRYLHQRLQSPSYLFPAPSEHAMLRTLVCIHTVISYVNGITAYVIGITATARVQPITILGSRNDVTNTGGFTGQDIDRDAPKVRGLPHSQRRSGCFAGQSRLKLLVQGILHEQHSVLKFRIPAVLGCSQSLPEFQKIQPSGLPNNTSTNWLAFLGVAPKRCY